MCVCIYIYIRNIHRTHTYIMYTKTFILDVHIHPIYIYGLYCNITFWKDVMLLEVLLYLIYLRRLYVKKASQWLNKWQQTYCSILFSVTPVFWQVKPLIWIESVIEKFSHSRIEIKVKVELHIYTQSTHSTDSCFASSSTLPAFSN